ncbi:MAG: MBL fold metallo-hydrolase [Waddliaceae bacterium]
MIFHQIYTPGIAAYSYIVGCSETKKCVIVDPIRDPKPFVEIIEKSALTVSGILETHVHADFVSGAKELKDATGAPIYSSAMGGKEWLPHYADEHLKDGDVLTVGTIDIQALHTPGHTPEHLCYALYEEVNGERLIFSLLTGDLLFAGDIGRPDLMGDRATEILAPKLYESIFQRIVKLPDHVTVYPAHGGGSLCGKSISSKRSTTIGLEKRENPMLQVRSFEEWYQRLIKDMPKAPPYFSIMKKVNVRGPKLMREIAPVISSDLPEDMNRLTVIDTRSQEAIAKGYLPHAFHIPLDSKLVFWAGWIIPYDEPLLLIVTDKDAAEKAKRELLIIGLDQLKHITVGYEKDASDLWKVTQLHPSELSKSGAQVVDVRSDAEWDSGHIEGATHLSITELATGLKSDLDKSKPIVTVCGSGHRSMIAASLLKKQGFQDVMSLTGGMNEWKKLQ